MSDLKPGIERQLRFAGGQFDLGQHVVNVCLLAEWVIGCRDDCPVGRISGRDPSNGDVYLVDWRPGTPQSHHGECHASLLVTLAGAQDIFDGLPARISSLARPIEPQEAKCEVCGEPATVMYRWCVKCWAPEKP